MEELKFLEEQQVAPELIKRVEEFRSRYEVAPETAGRIVKPSIPFYGKDILEMAIAGLLKGENLLLTGPKATGKNILAENLAYIFNRPAYNVSFHVNTNSGDLIGTDTFVDNEVKLPLQEPPFLCRIRLCPVPLHIPGSSQPVCSAYSWHCLQPLRVLTLS